MPAWIDGGHDFSRITRLSAHEVERRGADSLVLDVRSDQEWNDGYISKATHSMLGDLPKICIPFLAI
jgi:rhodanese-related sulfurtransferase